jgi:hypothetical protein|tara:strand:- start:25 stop:294 length:270 start_codon:yes stop_codon:yes gene_type:complete
MSNQMSLTIRMCAVNKPNLDKLIKNNKRLKSTFHSKKPLRNTHRIALDELDTFLELVDDAIDAMDDTQMKLNKLYDFCGEVPFDDECNY